MKRFRARLAARAAARQSASGGVVAPPMFSPTSIPGCKLWLDGADASTVTLSGGNVSQWRDKSTGSNNFSTSSTGATYSNNALNFNGTAGLTNASQNGFVTGSSNSFVTFIVFNTSSPPNPGDDARGLFSYGGFIGGQASLGYFSYIEKPLSFFSTTIGAFYASTAISLNNTTIATDSWSNNGTASNYTHFGWLNGTRFTSDGTTVGNMNITLSANAYIGASIFGATSYRYIGDIQEFLYYSGSLSTSQRQTIEGYLAWKWGQQTSLPGDHLYKSVAPTP
jgi:hypothetical protein